MPGQEEFSETCALFGFYVLVLGLLIECLDQAGGFFDLHHLVTLHVFYGAPGALNVTAMMFLLQLIVKVSRLQLSES